MQIDTGPVVDLITVAENNVRDCEFLRADLASVIFPQSNQPVSEEMLAFVRRDNLAIVTGIARAICGDAHLPKNITDRERLRHFSTDPALLEFFIARYAACRLEKRLSANNDIPLSQSLPARLLAEPDHNIAECGQIILAASGFRRRGGAAEWAELPSEILHQIVWRMVADLENMGVGEREANRTNAQKMLADHSESYQADVAAKKFLHLAEDRFSDELNDIGKSGLALFIAKISMQLKLAPNHILRLIDGPSLSACAIFQRGLDIPEELAMQNICLLYGFELTPHDITLFEQGYSQITQEQAAQAALGWHIDRLQSLPHAPFSAGGKP